MGRFKELTMGYPVTPEEIQAHYFLWLCDIVEIDRGKYWILTNVLHRNIYHWSIPNDDNRAEDGKKLREMFADEFAYSDVDFLFEGACTLFEMLVGLSIRMEDILTDLDDENRTADRFWLLIQNLGLDDYSDEEYDEVKVDSIIYDLLNRRYKMNGRGGLFPLKYPKRDQRDVEIWYQMSAYLLENYNIGETNV